MQIMQKQIVRNCDPFPARKQPQYLMYPSLTIISNWYFRKFKEGRKGKTISALKPNCKVLPPYAQWSFDLIVQNYSGKEREGIIKGKKLNAWYLESHCFAV